MTKDTEDYKVEADNWEDNVEAVFKQFKQQFKCERIQIPEKSARNNNLSKRLPESSQHCQIKIIWEESAIVLVGRCEELQKTVAEAKEVYICVIIFYI